MSPEFHTTLDVRLLPETDNPKWQLINQLVFFSEVMDEFICVPEGFITDFVSFEPLKNVGQRAAVVHDYLYSCSDIDRKTADRVLLEALECTGVDQDLAAAMYDAVRLFGGGHKANIYTFREVPC